MAPVWLRPDRGRGPRRSQTSAGAPGGLRTMAPGARSSGRSAPGAAGAKWCGSDPSSA